MPMIPVKEAPRGVRISEPTYKEHETDLLIVGGGMGGGFGGGSFGGGGAGRSF